MQQLYFSGVLCCALSAMIKLLCRCFVGFPPVADLAQLVLSWKPRQSASAVSVHCQTNISGDVESCMPPSSPPQSHQQKKKKQGLTIRDCIKLREGKAAEPSVCQNVGVSSAEHGEISDSADMPRTETSQPTVANTSHKVSLLNLSTESYVPSSVDPTVQLSSLNGTAAQAIQNLPMPLSAAATVLLPQNSCYPSNSAFALTSDFPQPVSSHCSVAISEVGGQHSTANTLTNSVCHCERVCSSVTSADVSSSHSLFLQPSSSRHVPMVVPASVVPTYRVTERVTSGTVLVDMDISSSVFGSGLVCGTFVYHGGRLVLGQQRQNNSSIPVWPMLQHVSPPVYFLAGARPVVAVTMPSEALVNGLRVVCNGISNVVNDDSRLPMHVANTQSHGTATVESGASTVCDGSHNTVEGSSKVLAESSQPVSEPSNSNMDHTEENHGVPVTGVSALDGEHCGEVVNSSESSSPASAAPLSTADIHQRTVDGGIIAAEQFEVESISSTAQSVPCTNGHVLTSFSGMQVIGSSSATSNDVVTNSQFILPTECSCADAVTSCTSHIMVYSAPLSCELSTGSKVPLGESTEIPTTAISKQTHQHGTKRKPAFRMADECSSKMKVARMDSQKRISKYICPPPDSAGDKDSKVIHIMDRFCDRSVEQYLCSVQRSASSQHLAADSLHSASEDCVSVVSVLPSIAVSVHSCSSSGRYAAGQITSSILSVGQPSRLNCEETTSQFSASTRSLCRSQLQNSHLHLYDNNLRVDGMSASHSKGFTLANVLSTTTASNLLMPSLSQQSSSIQTSKNDRMEKNSDSLLVEPVATQNHNLIPVNRISSSAITCDSTSNMLPDDLSLTDNDFAMILSDTDDGSLFSLPSRRSVDNNYWSFGFSSVCGRLRDRPKDGHGVESVHASTEDLYHSVVPVFREQNAMPETHYEIGEHIDISNKVGFSVSSLTCKTTSVCNTSSSLQTANSVSNSTLCQTSPDIPHSYLPVSQPGEVSLAHTNSHAKLQETNQTSKVMCSAVQSSARGIFSLVHHAIQPASKSFLPNSSGSSKTPQSASLLWSPCNGNAYKSNDTILSDHRQSLNIGRECRRSSSAVTEWRVPEPSNFGPLYTSWSDNLYSAVQPLARPRPFMDQTANAQMGTCNMQSKTPFPKIHSVSETDQEHFRGRWPSDDFGSFVSNKNMAASGNPVQLNCQYNGHQKVSHASSQPLWTYAECSSTVPESYLSTSRGWFPTSSDTSAAMTFDLSLSGPATCLSASSCRLPSFSFATVPPVPDFLSLSFATTAASTNTATGTVSEVTPWPVTLTVTTGSSNAPAYCWSPIFPQHTALQSRHVISATSSSVASSATASNNRRQDTRPDVTYTVPSFIQTDKESHKQPSSFNTHLPSYTLWHGAENVPVEMCHLPPVSVINSDAQILPIHGRGLYSGSEAVFITNTLASPPLHHHPVYCNQQPGVHSTGEKQVTFETPFSLPRLPLTSQVLNFSASFETIPPAASVISSEAYHHPSFYVSNVPVPIKMTENARQSQSISQSHRPTNAKRLSKYPKQLKHNAPLLCVGYPPVQNGTLPQSVVGDVPTYLPAGPFVGGNLGQKSHSSESQSFGSVFGSCSLRHGLAGEFSKSFSVPASDPQTTVSLPNQRHNFDIGAFISELSSNSLPAVTAPAAIRRLDFPTPPVYVLQQPVGASEHYQPQMECNQSNLLASDHASHNFGLHNMSINSLLGDNAYAGFSHRYEVYSDMANPATSTLPAFDVPTLNFSIRSQTPAVNFERPHNTKARHT